ncbi:MAG: hypothetical protein F7C38_00325 [Desulfurococcales archaeon]|nr:hypothetical protein [Desulfurococcales archaeon]
MPLPQALSRLLKEFTLLVKGIFQAMKQDSVSVLELEYLEAENAFLSLVIGGLVGLHIVPLGLSMELAPLLKDEISIMEKRHFLGSDVLADYFSELGGEW